VNLRNKAHEMVIFLEYDYDEACKGIEALKVNHLG
jgi:hypothetical protein